MHEKYGSIATSGEMMLFDLLDAQRRTNELLEKMFMLQQKPVTNPTGAKPSTEELKAMGGAPKAKDKE